MATPISTKPIKFQFQCTYEILNTLAVSSGVNGRSRASKCVVLAKKLVDGTIGICITKNKETQSFLAKNIKLIRRNFIAEGKLTIEFSAPPVNLMLRDAPSGTLLQLLDFLGSGVDKEKGKCKSLPSASTSGAGSLPGPSSSSKSSTSNLRSRKILDSESDPACPTPNQGQLVQRKTLVPNYKLKENAQSSSSTKDKKLQKLVPTTSGSSATVYSCGAGPSSSDSSGISDLRKNEVAMADFSEENLLNLTRSSLNLTSKEAKSVRKTFRGNVQTLKIVRREDIPLPHKKYPSTLNELTISQIGLRKMDSRILGLRNLHTLKLNENKLQCVHKLKKLTGRLVNLSLANNEISRLPEDFFEVPALQGLHLLDLSGNQLESLPSSIINLSELRFLKAENNKLQFLPYNMILMTSLQKLHVSRNQLKFLPHAIMLMDRCYSLSEIDVSHNDLFNPENLVKPESVHQVGYEKFPTLFELATSAVANHNYQNRNNEKNQIPIEPHELPRILFDSIKSCKMCLCRKMKARYKIIDRVSTFMLSPQLYAIGLTSATRFPMKIVVCDACMTYTMTKRGSFPKFD